MPIEPPAEPPDDRDRQQKHCQKFEVFSIFRHWSSLNGSTQAGQVRTRPACLHAGGVRTDAIRTFRLTPTTRYWAGAVSLLQFNVARKNGLVARAGLSSRTELWRNDARKTLVSGLFSAVSHLE